MLMILLIRGRRAAAALIPALGLLLAAGGAKAQAVPTCNALTLYGNMSSTGLCSALSPATQNLWVCSITAGVTDVHTTFNLSTPLHFTVRILPAPPNCEGNSQLTGSWPALAIAAGQPHRVCGVSIPDYVTRLNAVPQAPPGGTTACRAGFLAAGAAGRISQATMQSYLNTCAAQNCP